MAPNQRVMLFDNGYCAKVASAKKVLFKSVLFVILFLALSHLVQYDSDLSSVGKLDQAGSPASACTGLYRQ
jgi:hypothetical protein